MVEKASMATVIQKTTRAICRPVEGIGAYGTLPAMADQNWTSETVPLPSGPLHLTRSGSGTPLLLLHHDIGSPERLPFYDALAQRFTVIRPSHPGYDKSERPGWMRSVRDIAIVYQALIAHFELRDPTLVGLGFGGWIAAEMATMAPRGFKRLVLVGAMGIKPERGEIADQALLSYIDYVRLGFSDQTVYDRIYGADTATPQLEQWDLNREMTFRIAWRPYMFNPTLPHLLGAVQTPALVVWGRKDRMVPLECGERYVKALPHAKLEVIEDAGHFVEMEKPEPLARLIGGF
jgi:pimeloyl-ACP methyl ester carboxylesterase